MESIKYALWLEKTNCNVFLFKEAYHETEKILTLFLTIAMSFSMLVGCGNSTSAESKDTAIVTESTNTTDKKQKADENQDAAKQLLIDLTGSYQELWPVILDEKYQQIWIDDCTELVGE